jgi:uncharacterized protein (TIRG00374 family)
MPVVDGPDQHVVTGAGASSESAADNEKPKRSLWDNIRRGVLFMGVGLFAVYAWLVATAGGGGDLALLFKSARPGVLFLPLAATLLSYVTMSLSYQGIARAAGCPIGPVDMLRITFVANTANYVLPTGGLSGFALRMVMLNKKGVTAGRAVLISFTQTLLTNVMLMVFIVYGLIHLMVTGQLTGVSVGLVGVVVVGLTAFLLGCLLLVYRKRLRARVLDRVTDIVLRIMDRFRRFDRHERRVRRFFLHIDEGMEFFASRPRAMVAPLIWIFLDWVLTVAVLYAAFVSIGSDVSFSQVLIAFSVGIVFAVMSFVPGGVGVLEVALTGMFDSAGVPRDESVLAILIFRVSFYVIPVILALLVARSAFREVDGIETQEVL